MVKSSSTIPYSPDTVFKVWLVALHFSVLEAYMYHTYTTEYGLVLQYTCTLLWARRGLVKESSSS